MKFLPLMLAADFVIVFDGFVYLWRDTWWEKIREANPEDLQRKAHEEQRLIAAITARKAT